MNPPFSPNERLTVQFGKRARAIPANIRHYAANAQTQTELKRRPRLQMTVLYPNFCMPALFGHDFSASGFDN